MPHCSHLIFLLITGRHIPATEALKLGLVDEVVKEDTIEAAIRLANKVIGEERIIAMPRNNWWCFRAGESQNKAHQFVPVYMLHSLGFGIHIR